MFNKYEDFQNQLRANNIKMTNSAFNKILVDFNFIFLNPDNMMLTEINQKKIQSKIIIIYESNQLFDDNDYFILCFDNILIIMHQFNLPKLKPLFLSNQDSIIYCLSMTKSIIEKQCPNQNFNFSKENNCLFFDSEIPSFSDKLDIKLNKNNKNIVDFWRLIQKGISGILIKKSYQNTHYNRIDCFLSNQKEYISNSIDRNIDNKSIELDSLDLTTLSSVFLVYDIEKKMLIAKKSVCFDKTNKKLCLKERENYICMSENKSVIQNYPFIPKYYGSIEDEINHSLYIEFIDGNTLINIHELELNDIDKFNIIFELLLTFQYLHSLGFIYRDLKPNNVIVDKNKTAVLIDFDRMIKNSPEDKSLPLSGDAGTDFMDPRTHLDNNYSYEVDIYSLGLLIFYIIMEEKYNKYASYSNNSKYYKIIKLICEACTDNDITKRPTIDKLIRLFYVKIILKSKEKQKANIKLIQILEKSVINNLENHDGLYSMGFIYAIGNIIPKNLEKAIYYLKLAAEKNNVNSLNMLGNIFLDEYQNLSKALDYYYRAVEKNDVSSCNNLYHIYYDNKYIEKDIHKAFYYAELAANLKDAESQYNLGCFYYYGEGIQKDERKAIQLLTLSAEQKYPYALFALGTLYYNEQKIEDAIKYYALAIENLYQESLDNFYMCEIYNNSISEAFTNLHKEINKGNTEAYYNLGMIHYKKNNINEAIKYFTVAADCNHIESQLQLGIIYFYLLKDKKNAIYYFTLAAKSNDMAQLFLGIYYSNANYALKDIKKSIYYYQLAANQKNPYALSNLAYIYYMGINVPKDINKAIYFYQLAADMNDTKAQYMLGMIYFQNKNYQDIEKAIYYFSLSAHQGNQFSQTNLGLIYSNAKNKCFDIQKAIKYYNLAIKQKEPTALNNLGCLYYNGDFVKRDVSKGIELLTQSAKLNNPDAFFNLGVIYYQGIYIKNDINKAINYFYAAAEHNNLFALSNIGLIYYEGKYVKHDIKKAIHYLLLAAQKNNPYALNNLGCIFSDGYIPIDANKAINFFESAAHKNLPQAQVNLANIYYRGKIVSFNIKKAIKYYEMAASQNDADSIFNLAMIYYEGKYVERDIEKTIENLKELSSFENQYAKNNLGIIYKNGDGVKKDINTAIYYFKEVIQKTKNEVALFNLIHIYFFGEGVAIDLNKSMNYCFELAKKNIILSSDLLFLIIFKKFNSIGIEKFEEEMKNYEESTKKIVSKVYKNIKSDPISFERYFMIYDRIQTIELIYTDFSGEFMPVKEIFDKKHNSQNQRTIDDQFYEGFGI